MSHSKFSENDFGELRSMSKIWRTGRVILDEENTYQSSLPNALSQIIPRRNDVLQGKERVAECLKRAAITTHPDASFEMYTSHVHSNIHDSRS